MKNLLKCSSLIRVAVTLVVMGYMASQVTCTYAQVTTGGGRGDPHLEGRQFYVTQTTHTGAEALTACSEGYHMASMWEILDPSNLVYNVNLGATQDDSGQGPPNDFDGWVRTGNNASTGGSPGSANCNAWISEESDDDGTSAELVQSAWQQGGREFTMVAPWAASTNSCDTENRVWCIEDVETRDAD